MTETQTAVVSRPRASAADKALGGLLIVASFAAVALSCESATYSRRQK
jgi:hypothetical protein